MQSVSETLSPFVSPGRGCGAGRRGTGGRDFFPGPALYQCGEVFQPGFLGGDVQLHPGLLQDEEHPLGLQGQQKLLLVLCGAGAPSGLDALLPGSMAAPEPLVLSANHRPLHTQP